MSTSRVCRKEIIFCLLAVGALAMMSACVPSPTATPPRQTPFPTLPLYDASDLPNPGATGVPNQPNGKATVPPGGVRQPAALPTPTLVLSASSAIANDTLPPVALVTVQDPGAPVSEGQPVAVNVLAADNTYVVRLDLYDNGALIMQAPAVLPAAVYSNQFTYKGTAPGKHTLRAVAYDAAGNASAPVDLTLNVITNNRAPTVLITSPAGNRNAEVGAPILVQGVATDDVAVTRMDLIVDNQLVTFTRSAKPEGETPFAAALPWTPTTTGAHNIVLRAYDNTGQSDDSLRYSVQVFDNQPPVVTAASENAALAAGDALVVQALALANNGISRLELYVDNRLADAVNIGAALAQTSLSAELTASDLTEGAHTFFVRAYDGGGLTTDSTSADVTVSASVPLVAHNAPTPGPSRTPAPALATPSSTLVLPGPPTVQVQLVGEAARAALPGPIRVQVSAHGSTELDHIELWMDSPGAAAQVLLDENVKGATDKLLEYDWTPPRAGVFELSARVTDNLGQSRVSAPIHVEVRAPAAPTPAPVGFDFSETWLAESPAASYQVTFNQLGKALRGTMVEKRANGVTLKGRIVSGAVTDTTARFGVDFAEDAAASEHTLTFDCSFNPRPPALTCNFTDEDGNRGSAILTPQVKP